MRSRIHLLFLSIFTWMLGVVFLLLAACGVHYDFSDEMVQRDRGGIGLPVLDLPFSSEESHMCVQGVNGSFSHRYSSTRYDLDLDTPNDRVESVYAPSAGVARVHKSVGNFGTHINVDRGDGTYVVLGHLSNIFVGDGQEVALGQLLGEEGCTGACTGDHLHLGLHQGEAWKPAEFGVSIPVGYRIASLRSKSGSLIKAASEFVCGIKSAGDSRNGLYYTSVLETALWHPNGTLVKTAGNPKVFRIDNGALRWIVDEQVFWSYGYNFSDVVLISDEEYSCYPHGEPLSFYGLVDGFTDQQGRMWLVVGPPTRRDRYRILVRSHGWREVYSSWGLRFQGAQRPLIHDSSHGYILEWPVRDGFASFRDGTLVREESDSGVFIVSDSRTLSVMNWDSFLFAGYLPERIVLLPDGLLDSFGYDRMGCYQGSDCVSRETLAVCGFPPASAYTARN